MLELGAEMVSAECYEFQLPLSRLTPRVGLKMP
jgi:hypothetical protein